MGEFFDLKAEDGHVCDAYKAIPKEPAKAGLLIIQEIFGVNDHIQSVCDSFAKKGYLVIAPSIFDRIERKVRLAYTAEGIVIGRQFKEKIGWEFPLQDIDSGLSVLRQGLNEGTKIGVVGYCFGGTLAWLSSCRLGVDCAIGYYGGQINKFMDETPTAPTMLHFGTEDEGIPTSVVKSIREVASKEVSIFEYEGAGHGFNCDARADYHPESAVVASERSMKFLSDCLG